MISTAQRRQYIEDRLHTDWGWSSFTKGPTGYSYRDMVGALQRAFGIDEVPGNPMTIKRDIDRMRTAAELPDEEILTEAAELLRPENFPEWRARFFRVPETGEPFETPPFQHAIFWVMHAATFKVALPQWVIDLLDDLHPAHPFPEDINKLLTGEEKAFLSFVLLMAPRHGKTELGVHFVLHTHALDPNKRLMFGNGTQKKSEGFIDNAIMSMMEGNDPLSEDFLKMYGPFEHDKRAWSKQGYVLAGREHSAKSFSMQPFGISGNIRSFDSDAILADDLQSLQRARSETVTEEDYLWYTTELMLRREYQTALINLGSHVAVQTGDLFTYIENNLEKLNYGRQRTILKKLPAHFYDRCNLVGDPEHTRCLLWPSVRDYGFLEAQRAALDDEAMYEAVYQQVPQQRKMMHFPAHNIRAYYTNVDIGGDGVTPPPQRSEEEHGVLDQLREWRTRPMCCGVETISAFGFDPAASERKGASFSALVHLAGCTKCGRRYLVDYWKGRQSPEAHPEIIGDFVVTYPYVAMINIETNAYQKALARDPRMQELEAHGKFIIKEWNTDERKHDPEQGIPAAARHVKSGMLSIPYRTLYDQDFAETLLKEFIRWPQKPNDLVMAYWLAELALYELLEDAKYVDAEVMPGSEKWMSDWHEETTYTVDLSEISGDDGEYR